GQGLLGEVGAAGRIVEPDGGKIGKIVELGDPTTGTDVPARAGNVTGPAPAADSTWARGPANMYAAPCSTLAPAAPTTTVAPLPLRATGPPKLAPPTASEPVSLAVSVIAAQPVPGLTNTYAAPW